jgi:hypothetical protein
MECAEVARWEERRERESGWREGKETEGVG